MRVSNSAYEKVRGTQKIQQINICKLLCRWHVSNKENNIQATTKAVLKVSLSNSVFKCHTFSVVSVKRNEWVNCTSAAAIH